MPIYQPSDDSYLMSQTLKEEIPKFLNKNKNFKFLEIGIGSGINLQTIKSLGVKVDNIKGTDINDESVKHCKKLGFNCIKSDLFSNMKGKFDLIIFNPPYLPLDKKEPKSSQIITTGGKKGNEISIKFLKQAKNHLNKEGIILLITSSLSKDINFKKLGYKFREISSKKLFFEELSLWELKIN